MKKFVREILIITAASVMLFVLMNIIYFKLGHHGRMTAFEVYDAIDRTGQQTEYTALVLGDSVARQFFSPEDQDESGRICFLATNQAIMTAGNDILLERFIENNAQLKEVYYILRPDSLKSRANFIYTYSYFITPFFYNEYLKYLSADTVEALKNVYGRLWTGKEFPKWFLGKYPKALEMYNHYGQRIWEMKCAWNKENELPDMSLPYLKKMKQICDDRRIEFHLLAAPVPEKYEYDLEQLCSEMDAAGMPDLYEELTDSMQYVEGTQFVDGIHLNKEYVQANKESIRKNILESRRK